MLCGMWDLIPWPGIKPMPSAVGAQNLNYWATREVLKGIGSCILDTCTQSLSLSLSHPSCDFSTRNCSSGFPRLPELSPTSLTPPHGPPVASSSPSVCVVWPGQRIVATPSWISTEIFAKCPASARHLNMSYTLYVASIRSHNSISAA